MSGPAALPLLMHPIAGVPLPFWDTRQVPPQTLCEYLGVDRGVYASLLAQGVLTPPGGAVQLGAVRSSFRFIPAVIWAVNRWTPPADVLALLAADRGAVEALRTAAERLCSGLADLRQPRTPIPFVAAHA